MAGATQPAAARLPASGTVLSFDFGTRRVGVAVGDLSLGIAHPAATIDAEDNVTRFAAIERLVSEWKPALLVVGLPVHMDGTEHEMTRLARRFANRLEGRFGLPVELADERLSSEDAALALAEAGTRPERRRRVVDQVAAQRILQDYLDNRRRVA